jgi:hypothetical protein
VSDTVSWLRKILFDTFLFLVLWHEEPWLDISEISLLSNEKRPGPYHDIYNFGIAGCIKMKRDFLFGTGIPLKQY